MDGRRLGLRVEPCCLPHLVRGNHRDLGHPLQGVPVHLSPESPPDRLAGDHCSVRQGHVPAAFQHRLCTCRKRLGPHVPDDRLGPLCVPRDKVLLRAARREVALPQDAPRVGPHQVRGVGPALHEVLVVEPLVHDHVQEAHGDGGVGAGPKLQPVFRAGREPGQPGVDRDDLGTPLHQVHDPVTEEVVGAGGRDVVPPDHHALGLAVPGILVAVLEPLPRVEDHVVPLDHLACGDAGGVARVARQGEDDVRAPVGVGEQRDPGVDVAAGSHREEKTLGTVLVADLLQPRLDQVIGLLPGDLLPLPLPPFAHPLEGLAQPVGVVDVLGHRQPTGTQATLTPGVIRVTLDLHQPAVLDVRDHAASPVAAGPRGPRGGSNLLHVALGHDPGSLKGGLGPSSGAEPCRRTTRAGAVP